MGKHCTDSAQHSLHLCQFKKKGLLDEILKRSSNPAYVCHNCNALADNAQDLCNPGALPGKG